MAASLSARRPSDMFHLTRFLPKVACRVTAVIVSFDLALPDVFLFVVWVRAVADSLSVDQAKATMRSISWGSTDFTDRLWKSVLCSQWNNRIGDAKSPSPAKRHLTKGAANTSVSDESVAIGTRKLVLNHWLFCYYSVKLWPENLGLKLRKFLAWNQTLARRVMTQIMATE